MDAKELTIQAEYKKHVAIIGGGFFGLMAALKLAERGFFVTIFEKNTDIMFGASYINQNRMHMGYHYPRSEETARSSFIFQKSFCKLFQESVVNDFDHYYCIAKQGSEINGKQYTDFCDKLGLPYSKEFPKTINVSKDKVEICIKVPEKLYDANLLRKSLKSMLAKENKIKLLLSTEVVDINKVDNKYEIHGSKNGNPIKINFDAVLNATYSNINTIAKMAGFDVKQYQYELCEVPITKVPWRIRTGCAIMDGPFFGILPFGFSEEYLLYDVNISVLDRCIKEFPEFKHDISYYDQKKNKAERFKRYIEKAKEYIKEMEKCTHLYSIYVIRIVLPDKEADDARPTEILYHGDGFWSVFSGKVSAAIPASQRIVEEMDRYFNNQKII